MQEGARVALATGNRLRAGRFFNAAGGSSLLASDFRAAMECLRRAVAEARGALHPGFRLLPEERDSAQDLIAAASVNLASLYLKLEDRQSAEQLLVESGADLRPNHPFEAQILILRAMVVGQDGDPGLALDLLARALASSDRRMDWENYSAALQWRGFILSQQKRFDEAEASLLEAFRLRVIHRKPGKDDCLRRLAVLELKRGDPARAYRYIRAAGGAKRGSASSEARWKTNTILGQILQAMGKKGDALAAYRLAQEDVAQWRSALIPSFAVMAEADVTTSQLSVRHADLAAGLASQDGSPELAAESLFAVLRQRASSVMKLQSRHALDTPIGPEYLSVLARLRRLEMSTRPEDEIARRNLRRQAADLEMKVLPGFDLGRTGQVSDGEMLRSIRLALPADSAALVFLVGPERSWRWVVGRRTLQVRQLPARREIAAAVDGLRNSLGERERARAGEMLLSELPAEALAANHWYLSLDGPLFEVPFAALSLPGEQGQPLVVSRSLQVVPALLSLLQPSRSWKPGPLLAVADPIYNLADPRLPRRSRSITPLALGFWLPRLSPAAQPERPRLAASLQEAHAVRAFWMGRGQAASLLTGAEVEARSMAAALTANPAQIHIATHIDPGEEAGPAESGALTVSPSVALSLHPDGSADALRPEALMRLRLPASVVVMSGCDSGRGRVRPGLGVTGLSQAWLLGGASAVVGSLWPVRDQPAELFVAFYRALAGGLTPARALRRAQLEAIRAGGWHADPFYWAAWTLTGN